MAKREGPTVIRKYANRRLYNTGTSTYVTLDDLAAMVKAGETFVAVDARSDADITHQVLMQIIVDLETHGPTLMTADFLRRLIRFYGSGLEALVPVFLDRSLATLAGDGDRVGAGFERPAGERDGDGRLRRAISAFEAAMAGTGDEAPAAPVADRHSGEFDELKAELDAVRRRLDRLGTERE